MSDEQPDLVPIVDPSPDVRDGINLPNAVEQLLADMDAIKTRVADLEAKAKPAARRKKTP